MIEECRYSVCGAAPLCLIGIPTPTATSLSANAPSPHRKEMLLWKIIGERGQESHVRSFLRNAHTGGRTQRKNGRILINRISKLHKQLKLVSSNVYRKVYS